MTNIYTSDFLLPTDNSVDYLITRIELNSSIHMNVFRYNSSNELIEELIFARGYFENGNCPEDKTRIRVFLNNGQISPTDKIKVELNTIY